MILRFPDGRPLPPDYDPHLTVTAGPRTHVLPVDLLRDMISGKMPIANDDDGEEILRAIAGLWLEATIREKG